MADAPVRPPRPNRSGDRVNGFARSPLAQRRPDAPVAPPGRFPAAPGPRGPGRGERWPSAAASAHNVVMGRLERLAFLLESRNDIDEKIAALIGRPAIRGHVGEWIACEIFGVTLEENAVQEGFDGRFADGSLAEKTVNVKWYGKREGVLDINPHGVLPNYYLVMTGPKAVAAMNSRGPRPLVITEVFLFDAPALVERLDVRVGVATSVRQREWEAARVYPAAAPGVRLTLTDAQREALKLFAENHPAEG